MVFVGGKAASPSATNVTPGFFFARAFLKYSHDSWPNA